MTIVFGHGLLETLPTNSKLPIWIDGWILNGDSSLPYDTSFSELPLLNTGCHNLFTSAKNLMEIEYEAYILQGEIAFAPRDQPFSVKGFDKNKVLTLQTVMHLTGIQLCPIQ